MNTGCTKLTLGCLLVLPALGCQPPRGETPHFDMMGFFQKITAKATTLDGRAGEPQYPPNNVLTCQQPIASQTNNDRYYDLTRATREGGADTYGPRSTYAAEMTRAGAELTSLMELFLGSGFVETLVDSGVTPALMFDLDNTLQFTAEDDGSVKFVGGPITPMTDFARKYCFARRVDCYFITARECERTAATATETWMASEFGFGAEVLQKHVFVMGSMNSCNVAGVKLAYKDSVRKILSEQRKVYWLMSIGDQLTDSFGPHSGYKVLLPNLFLRSSIVPDQLASTAPGTSASCRLVDVEAPSEECNRKLEGEGLLGRITLSACKQCASKTGCY